MNIHNSEKTIKLSLFILAISAFCIGTTEFIAVGLLPNIAKTFNISIELASITISGYAVGVALGAPILTMLTNKINRKTLLILLMLVFTLGNLVASLSTNFLTFMIARVFTSFSHGVFFSIAGVIASNLVTNDKKAAAISKVFTGLTIATITGVPIGTYIGDTFNWRLSFILITILGLISLISISIVLPKKLNITTSSMNISQLKILTNKKITLTYIATIFGYGGTFVMYTYVSSIIEKVMGYNTSFVSVILLFYGITLAIGNYIGGKLSNKNTLKSLMIMFIFQALSLLLFMIFMPSKILGLLSLLLLGVFAFMNVPGLQHYVIKTSDENYPEYSNFASALSISSFNIGIFLASAVGSQIVLHFSLRLTPLFGALFILVALISIIFIISSKNNSKVAKVN